MLAKINSPSHAQVSVGTALATANITSDDVATADLSSLQCFWYGAAPISAARLEEALHRIGPMAQLFGQTNKGARSKGGIGIAVEIQAAMDDTLCIR